MGWNPESQLARHGPHGGRHRVPLSHDGLFLWHQSTTCRPRSQAAFAPAPTTTGSPTSAGADAGPPAAGHRAVPARRPAALAEARAPTRRTGRARCIVRPNPVAGRTLASPELDPLWTLLRGGRGRGRVPRGRARARCATAAGRSLPHRLRAVVVLAPDGDDDGVPSLLEGGVLERHPRLRVGFLEAGCGWVPYWLWRLDERWEHVAHEVAEHRDDAAVGLLPAPVLGLARGRRALPRRVDRPRRRRPRRVRVATTRTPTTCPTSPTRWSRWRAGSPRRRCNASSTTTPAHSTGTRNERSNAASPPSTGSPRSSAPSGASAFDVNRKCCTTAWTSRSRRCSGLVSYSPVVPLRVVAAVHDGDGDLADAAQRRSPFERLALFERPSALHALEVGAGHVVRSVRATLRLSRVRRPWPGTRVLREAGHEAAERPLRAPDGHEVVYRAPRNPTARPESSGPAAQPVDAVEWMADHRRRLEHFARPRGADEQVVDAHVVAPVPFNPLTCHVSRISTSSTGTIARRETPREIPRGPFTLSAPPRPRRAR